MTSFVRDGMKSVTVVMIGGSANVKIHQNLRFKILGVFNFLMLDGLLYEMKPGYHTPCRVKITINETATLIISKSKMV